MAVVVPTEGIKPPTVETIQKTEYVCMKAEEAPNSFNISAKSTKTSKDSYKSRSAKRCRSRTCVVTGCSNGDYRLSKWKEVFCKVHKVIRGNEMCTCQAPFQLHTFPSEKRSKEVRDIWIKLINRKKKDGTKNWSPGTKCRVCSNHFVDKIPTESNPYPVLKLGYNSSSKILNVVPVIAGQKRKRKSPCGKNCYDCCTTISIDPKKPKSCISRKSPRKEKKKKDTTTHAQVLTGQQYNRQIPQTSSAPVLVGQQYNRQIPQTSSASAPVLVGQQYNRQIPQASSASAPVLVGQQFNRQIQQSLITPAQILVGQQFNQQIPQILTKPASVLATQRFNGKILQTSSLPSPGLVRQQLNGKILQTSTVPAPIHSVQKSNIKIPQTSTLYPVIAPQQFNRKITDCLNFRSFLVFRKSKYIDYILAVMVTISSILAFTGLWLDYYKKQLKNANYIIIILKNKNDLLTSQNSELKRENKELLKQLKELRSSSTG